MLIPTKPDELSDFDRQVFDIIVSPDHYLRQVAAHIDFERFRPRLEEAYCLDMGRPPIDAVRMFRFMFLRFHYKLSDRQVMARTETDIAFRWFLGLPSTKDVPHPSDCTNFRKRIGADRFVDLFQELITQAREAGLVKDRLRLKDATHLYANAADVQPLALAAQVRERLLQAAKPLFADWVEEQRVAVELLRQTTAEFPDDERLASRVEHLRNMAAQLRDRLALLPTPSASEPPDPARSRLCRALELVDKLVADREDPEAKDRLASGVDPDARVGMHGDFFLGYMMDMTIDPESELITAINVLPGNGAEAADAVTLIQQEESAQGNDVKGLSIDGAGYNGPVLRELTDPKGLDLEVTVPPPTPAVRTTFGPERFSLKVIDERTSELTCPAGETTQSRSRTRQGTGDRYQYRTKQCAGCEKRTECLENPESPRGRVVIKNDYEAEYKKVHEKAKTAEYQETRRVHPKIERKLGEVARHHGARQACFRGLPKVLTQAVLTAMVVNVKRIVKLLRQKMPLGDSGGTVRAELALT